MSFDYDLFVIGAGSGGVRARMAQPRRESGGAEEYRVGGTCVIRGCVPKKLLSMPAISPKNLKMRPVSVGRWPMPNLIGDIGENKDAEIDRLNGIYQKP